MFDSGKLEKLQIIPLKKNITKKKPKPDLDRDKAVTCQFNPESFTMNKTNKWTRRPDIGDSVPETVFSGGNAGSMTLQLLFDSTDTQDDVRRAYFDLIKFALVKPSSNPDQKGEPSQVVVEWGAFKGYVAVIESINQNFSLFSSEGVPLRAEVTLTLREVLDRGKLPPTNPTSRSEVRQTWMVEKGQRLDWIAYEIYGSTSAWRHIAETNGLLNPTVLRPGQILKIVPLE
ncbi:MAG: hypothetical protein IT328_17660 [Caldilineaceae bacterium]|nr:hypothetical protein [Caldilineaceae bacterium]